MQIVPPAPGLLSTMNGWPSWSDSCAATVRAITTVALPAGSGTTTCTGLSGQAWENAPPLARPSASTAPQIFTCFIGFTPARTIDNKVEETNDQSARRA